MIKEIIAFAAAYPLGKKAAVPESDAEGERHELEVITDDGTSKEEEEEEVDNKEDEEEAEEQDEEDGQEGEEDEVEEGWGVEENEEKALDFPKSLFGGTAMYSSSR